MNPIILLALQSTPAQAKEVGEFASAVLQRNIAVGAIVLLVMAVFAMSLWLRQMVTARIADSKTHSDQIAKMLKNGNETVTSLVDDANTATTARSAAIAKDYDAQREKFIELIVKVTELAANMAASVDKNTAEMLELRRIIDELRRTIENRINK